MSDETFRQQRKKITPEESTENPMEAVRDVQRAVAEETGRDMPTAMANDSPFEIKGNIPPEFQKALQQKRGLDNESTRPRRQPQMNQRATPDNRVRMQGSDELEHLLQQLASQHQWEEFEFCSRGVFYDKIPPMVHVRPMTGEEEQILATPRFVKKGKAIDMIFQKCIQENIDTEELLSADRTHLLIYLRGISYTPEYDVEIKCPECDTKFSTVINLDQLPVNSCPEDFSGKKLEGVLPSSGFSYAYRLATGADELSVTSYREQRIENFGDQSEDDTLLYRTATLLERIEGVTDRREIQVLLKKLPINDVSHLRNEINNPPFGVDTEVPMFCPSCTAKFEIDLPLEANFFFPKKKERTPA
jgi:hypothetical protein